MIWYNGGPGGSSVYGLLIEIGPLFLTGASLNVPPGAPPQLFYNPRSWAKHFNLLITGFPPPVGYSYCAQPEGCPVWNDTTAALDNFYFLQRFFSE